MAVAELPSVEQYRENMDHWNLQPYSAWPTKHLEVLRNQNSYPPEAIHKYFNSPSLHNAQEKFTVPLLPEELQKRQMWEAKRDQRNAERAENERRAVERAKRRIVEVRLEAERAEQAEAAREKMTVLEVEFPLPPTSTSDFDESDADSHWSHIYSHPNPPFINGAAPTEQASPSKVGSVARGLFGIPNDEDMTALEACALDACAATRQRYSCRHENPHPQHAFNDGIDFLGVIYGEIEDDEEERYAADGGADGTLCSLVDPLFGVDRAYYAEESSDSDSDNSEEDNDDFDKHGLSLVEQNFFSAVLEFPSLHIASRCTWRLVARSFNMRTTYYTDSCAIDVPEIVVTTPWGRDFNAIDDSELTPSELADALLENCGYY